MALLGLREPLALRVRLVRKAQQVRLALTARASTLKAPYLAKMTFPLAALLVTLT